MDALCAQALRPPLPRRGGAGRRLAHALLGLRHQWVSAPSAAALGRAAVQAWRRLAHAADTHPAEAGLTAQGALDFGLDPRAG